MTSRSYPAQMLVLALTSTVAHFPLALSQAPTPDKVVETCIAAVRNVNEKAAYRREACLKLRELGPAAKAAIPPLMKALNDEQLAFWAACALTGIGPAARKAVEESIRQKTPDDRTSLFFSIVLGDETPFRTVENALHAPKEEMRYWALDTLACLGRVSPNVAKKLPDLAEPLARDDRHPQVRSAAAFALVEFAPQSDATVETLARVLVDKESTPPARAKAAKILGGFGKKAGHAETALVSALQQRDPVLAKWAATSLGLFSLNEKAIGPLEDLAKAAADMGLRDLYTASAKSANAIAERIEREKWRKINQQRSEAARRKAQEITERIQQGIKANENWLFEAKMRSDARVYGMSMTFGRQAHLDSAAYHSNMATMCQETASFSYAGGRTDEATSWSKAAQRHDREADWHRACAKKKTE